ncbi:helix-turn-helix transcriptional regulator [Paenibacillus tundrae]|uniref:DNA-binding transcriptional regulator YafY n=1 Tax=Paenibacillus tundrae TaxID=528187 RepID=A0ABT9W9F0_9BACL|nr:HTH domain-containing protein [Paenibacillus tundrae]MDQ0169856.1 putative DNA-binding transcriptional regulator YafY [Paenibacillus tundrae]
MNKINRLAAIVMALQHGHETARSLADKFEVSRRTILRDIQSLSEMNVPIIAISGPGGGFQLMEGYVLPPLQLDPVEAATIIFALEGISHHVHTPFQDSRWTVMDKIRGIIPEDVMARIDIMLNQLNHRIHEHNEHIMHFEPSKSSVPYEGWAESSLIRVKALLNHSAMVEAQQDEHIGEEMTEVSPGLWELSFLCPSEDWSWIVRFFYRLGKGAEVVEPEELRNEIRQHAADVFQLYACSSNRC